MASRHDALVPGGHGHGHGPGPALPGTKPGTDDQVASGHDHPSDSLYIRVAIILAVVTIIEVAIYYIPALSGVLVPVLIALSVGKFIAVIGYFMHLKFDSRLFRWMFVAGLAISASVLLALIALQWTSPYFAGFLPSIAE